METLKTIFDVIIIALLLFFPLLAAAYDIRRVNRSIAVNRLRWYIADKRNARLFGRK